MILSATVFCAYALGVVFGEKGLALSLLVPGLLLLLIGGFLCGKGRLPFLLSLGLCFSLAFFLGFSRSASLKDLNEERQKLAGPFEGRVRIIREAGEQAWIGFLEEGAGCKVLVWGEGSFPPGSQLQVRGRLLLPGEGMNRGSFDYRAYLRYKGIPLILDVAEAAQRGRVRDISAFLEGYKESYLVRMEKLLGEEAAGYVKSIFLGDSKAMGEEALEAWREMGIAHLQAVSGSQAGVLLELILFLHILTPGRHIMKRLAFLSIFLAYGFLTDSPSVWRVILSAGAAGFCNLAGWEREPLDFLFIGGLLQLIWRPGDLFSLSFQLSFIIAMGLGFFQQHLKEMKSWSQLLLAGIFSFAFSLPFSLSAFQKAPLGGILFTPFAAPLVQGIIIGSAICFLMPVSLDFLVPLAWFLQAVIRILEAAVSWGRQLWLPVFQGRPWPALAVFSYYGGLISYSRGWKKLVCLCAALFLLGLCLQGVEGGGRGEVQIIFINVGQGDAVLIRGEEGGAFLIDGGPPGAGEREAAPYLRRMGIFKLDMAMGTHGDQDHIGGLEEVLREIPAEIFLMPPALSDKEGRFRNILDAHGGLVRELAAGMAFSWEGISFLVLAPVAESLGEERNEASIVLKMAYQGVEGLLTGDCSLEVMEGAVARGPFDIVKVPHHGSRDSWEPGLYRSLGTGLAVFSVGPNRYGHPHQPFLIELEEAGIPYLRTDQRKDIRIRIFRGEMRGDFWNGEVKSGLQ